MCPPEWEGRGIYSSLLLPASQHTSISAAYLSTTPSPTSDSSISCSVRVLTISIEALYFTTSKGLNSMARSLV